MVHEGFIKACTNPSHTGDSRRHTPGGDMTHRRMLFRLDPGARVRHGIVLALALVALLATPAAAQVSPRPRPEGVTDSTIAWGRQLFHGSANCASCHGVEARGTDEGPRSRAPSGCTGPARTNGSSSRSSRAFPRIAPGRGSRCRCAAGPTCRT